jgi:hypothetical protein
MLVQLSIRLFSFVNGCWLASADSLLSTLSSFSKGDIGTEQLSPSTFVAENCKLCLKILRRLVLFGLQGFVCIPALLIIISEDLQQNEEAQKFLNTLHDRLNVFMMCSTLQ